MGPPQACTRPLDRAPGDAQNVPRPSRSKGEKLTSFTSQATYPTPPNRPTLHRAPTTHPKSPTLRPPSGGQVKPPQSPNRPTLHPPSGRQVHSPRLSQPAYPTPRPGREKPTKSRSHTTAPPSPPCKARQLRRWRALAGKSRRRRAYPQQIVTTRLLYCLQDPFAQLSRLQRI